MIPTDTVEVVMALYASDTRKPYFRVLAPAAIAPLLAGRSFAASQPSFDVIRLEEADEESVANVVFSEQPGYPDILYAYISPPKLLSVPQLIETLGPFGASESMVEYGPMASNPTKIYLEYIIPSARNPVRRKIKRNPVRPKIHIKSVQTKEVSPVMTSINSNRPIPMTAAEYGGAFDRIVKGAMSCMAPHNQPSAPYIQFHLPKGFENTNILNVRFQFVQTASMLQRGVITLKQVAATKRDYFMFTTASKVAPRPRVLMARDTAMVRSYYRMFHEMGTTDCEVGVRHTAHEGWELTFFTPVNPRRRCIPRKKADDELDTELETEMAMPTQIVEAAPVQEPAPEPIHFAAEEDQGEFPMVALTFNTDLKQASPEHLKQLAQAKAFLLGSRAARFCDFDGDLDITVFQVTVIKQKL